MSKNRPKGPRIAYAFYVQHCREGQENTHPTENIEFSKFLDDCLGKWQIMSESDKIPFREMAENDIRRYNAEMLHFPLQSKIIMQTIKEECTSRPLSAFYWFCNDEHENVKKAHPEWEMGDVARELGKLWMESDRRVKLKYEELAEKDKVRYKKETAAYKRMNRLELKLSEEIEKEEEKEDEIE